MPKQKRKQTEELQRSSLTKWFKPLVHDENATCVERTSGVKNNSNTIVRSGNGAKTTSPGRSESSTSYHRRHCPLEAIQRNGDRVFARKTSADRNHNKKSHRRASEKEAEGRIDMAHMNTSSQRRVTRQTSLVSDRHEEAPATESASKVDLDLKRTKKNTLTFHLKIGKCKELKKHILEFDEHDTILDVIERFLDKDKYKYKSIINNLFPEVNISEQRNIERYIPNFGMPAKLVAGETSRH
ncbi:uncharacterized protein LOC102809936 [Saccoglossus kowalevskii]